MRYGSTMEKIANTVNSQFATEEREESTGGGKRKAKLVKDGRIISLVETAASTLAS